MFNKALIGILITLCFLYCTAYGVSAECEHRFEYDKNQTNTISNSDMTHSYYCLNGCGNYGTASSGINSSEKCSFNLVTEIEASCTDEGKRFYVCTVCYRNKEETVGKTGHRYEKIRRLPTCTEAGYDLYICCICGISYKDNFTQLLSHLPDGGVIELLPTYEKEGVIKSSCRVCDCVLERKTVPRLVKSDNKTASLNGNTEGKDNISSAAAAKPGKAVITMIKSSKKSQAVIRWKKQKNVKGYEISYSAYKFSKKKKVKAVTVTKGTQKTLKKLKSAKKYYFRIRAYKKFGSKKVYGAYSDTKTVKIR